MGFLFMPRFVVPDNHYLHRHPFQFINGGCVKHDKNRYHDSRPLVLKEKLNEIERKLTLLFCTEEDIYNLSPICFVLGYGSAATVMVEHFTRLDTRYHDIALKPEDFYTHPDHLVVFGYFNEQLMHYSFGSSVQRNLYRVVSAVLPLIGSTMGKYGDGQYSCYYSKRQFLIVHDNTHVCCRLTIRDYFT